MSLRWAMSRMRVRGTLAVKASVKLGSLHGKHAQHDSDKQHSLQTVQAGYTLKTQWTHV